MLLRLALLVPLLAAGCLSPSQHEAIRVQRAIGQAVDDSDTCLAPLRSRPEYQALYARLAIEPRIPPPAPTGAQLADTGLADHAAAQAMVALHGDLSVCRGPLIDSIGRIAPDMADTAVDIWLRGDRLVLALMRQEMSWGEANRQIGALQTEYVRRLADVVAATRRRIDASVGGDAAITAALPPAVVRFPADLTEIHRQMAAQLARIPG